MKVFLGLLLTCWLVGCTTTGGRSFDVNNVSKIREGKTSASEVLTLLGTPYQKHTSINGEERWIYVYSEVESLPGIAAMYGNSKATTEMVDLVIKSGVVKECTMTKSSKEGRGYVPMAGGGSGYDEKVRCKDL